MKVKKTAINVMLAMALTFSAAVATSHAQPSAPVPQPVQIDPSHPIILLPVPDGCGESPCEPK